MLPVLLSLGILYMLALGAGRISAALGIPRVTGYLAVGVAGFLEVSAMLATLFSGVATVNASPFGDRTIKDLSAVDYPLYVLFFIMAGVELHLKSLVHMG